MAVHQTQSAVRITRASSRLRLLRQEPRMKAFVKLVNVDAVRMEQLDLPDLH
jgi:hypothetical protein